MQLLEGLAPTDARFSSRSNDQLPLLDFQIDRSMQVTLFNDGFWNPDALGISDSHNPCFHCDLLHYLGGTLV
jgi:hypothetical protein